MTPGAAAAAARVAAGTDETRALRDQAQRLEEELRELRRRLGETGKE